MIWYDSKRELKINATIDRTFWHLESRKIFPRSSHGRPQVCGSGPGASCHGVWILLEWTAGKAPQASPGISSRAQIDLWIFESMEQRIQRPMDSKPCGNKATKPQSHNEATKLQGYKVTKPQSHNKATKLQGYKATKLQGEMIGSNMLAAHGLGGWFV